jgi:glycosyltransferase involved in cell wall biosynthesis
MLVIPLIYIIGGFNMNILYLTTSFPKINDGNTIYTDLAEALLKRGHELTVCVADQKAEKKIEQIFERDINQFRIKIPKYYNVNYFRKGISILLQPIFIKKALKKIIKTKNIDVILYEAPPISNMSTVRWLKKRTKAISYLMLKDIFPQNAVDLRLIKKNSLIYSYFRLNEKKLYKVSDLIGCMSKKNMEYIIQHNKFTTTKVKYFPNTKSIKFVEKIDINIVREKYNIPNNATVFIFGGNMGVPQYMEIHKNALINFKDNDNAFFIFVGRGSERKIIKEVIRKYEIKNVLLLDEIHRDEYEELVLASDVGLITLSPSFTIPNYPSRILSYMEFSKPIIAATDSVTDVKDLIEKSKCGYWVDSNNLEDYFGCIDKMIYDENKDEMGKRGYKYLVNNFTVEKSVNYLEKHISEVVDNV